MHDHYIALGFGAHGIYGAQRTRSILGHSMQTYGHVVESHPEADGFLVAYDSDDGRCIGPYTLGEFMTRQESSLFLVMLIDQSDPAAIDAATQVGLQAKIAGAYLSVAVLVDALPAIEVELLKSPTFQALQQSVDALVCVHTGSEWSHEDIPGIRVALALMSATLPSIVNMICTDITDMKQVLQGLIIAQISNISVGGVQTDMTSKALAVHVDINDGRHGVPQTVFSSYGASPDVFVIADMESTLGYIHDVMDATYPSLEVPYVVAGLLDPSLTDTAEIITCMSFG